MHKAYKYIIKKEREKNSDEVTAWYKECQRLHKPYIVIKTRTKYANIDFDHISLPKGYDKLLGKEQEKITDAVIKLIRKYGTKKSSYETNSLIIVFRDIPIENSEKLANDLFDLLNEIVN
jgi:hypothetical protein